MERFKGKDNIITIDTDLFTPFSESKFAVDIEVQTYHLSILTFYWSVLETNIVLSSSRTFHVPINLRNISPPVLSQRPKIGQTFSSKVILGGHLGWIFGWRNYTETPGLSGSHWLCRTKWGEQEWLKVAVAIGTRVSRFLGNAVVVGCSVTVATTVRPFV